MTATESNEAPIISIQNVWKFFGQLTALHDVSFDVQPGERVVIICLLYTSDAADE